MRKSRGGLSLSSCKHTINGAITRVDSVLNTPCVRQAFQREMVLLFLDTQRPSLPKQSPNPPDRYSPLPPAPVKPDPLANLFASPPTPTPAADDSGAAAAAAAGTMLMPTSSPGGADNSASDAASASTASVAIERRRATVPPGERLPVLLKFCALRPAAAMLTVSAVRWTVFQWNGGGGLGGTGDSVCPRVWVSHRLEGRGRLLHATLEQRAARWVVCFFSVFLFCVCFFSLCVALRCARSLLRAVACLIRPSLPPHRRAKRGSTIAMYAPHSRPCWRRFSSHKVMFQ